MKVGSELEPGFISGEAGESKGDAGELEGVLRDVEFRSEEVLGVEGDGEVPAGEEGVSCIEGVGIEEGVDATGGVCPGSFVWS